MLETSEKLVLNLGCGNDFYGTHRLDKVKTKATTLVCDVERGIPFPDGFFDEVYEKSLLEHLRNVGFHLQECYRVLKKGGILTLITDNASCIRYYLYGTHTGRYEREHRGDCHYSIFTPNHLRNHLMAVGFTIKELHHEKTDTTGRFFDSDFSQFFMPRIKAVSVKG